MTDPEQIAALQGRINALEALTTMFAGIVLAQAPNDPDYHKAVQIMDVVRNSALQLGQQTNNVTQTAEATDAILSSISENLKFLRP